MNKIILMKGLSCASKSTTALKLAHKYDAVVLSSDEIREEFGLEWTDKSVFNILDKRVIENIEKGINVIIDATNLSIRKHRKFKDMAKRLNAKLICNYVITHPYIWEQYADMRCKSKWTDLSIDDVLKIRQNQAIALIFPTLYFFDEIEYIVTDVISDNNSIEQFKKYYDQNKELFIKDTKTFFKPLYENGLLKQVMPEVYNMYNFNQENVYHKLTLENHTFKLCENLSNKNEVMIWAGLLHDTGKPIKGIKRRKPTGDYSYIGHAGISAEIAMCILRRLGFDLTFAEEVSTIINLHMYLPYEGELKKQKIQELGDKLYLNLLDFRSADVSAKE